MPGNGFVEFIDGFVATDRRRDGFVIDRYTPDCSADKQRPFAHWRRRATDSDDVTATGTTFSAAWINETSSSAANRQHDLISAPVHWSSTGFDWLKIQPEVTEVQSPDRVLLFATGQIDEEHAVKPFGPTELRRQFANVVRRADNKHIRFVIVEPDKNVPNIRDDTPLSLPPPLAPANAFSTSSIISTQGAMASTIDSACRVRSSDCPTSDPIKLPTSRVNTGRPTSLPTHLQNSLLPQPGGDNSITPRARRLVTS